MTGAPEFSPPEFSRPEFSRPVEIAQVFRKGRLTLSLDASPAERIAVAARLGLVDLASLKAELVLAPWQGPGQGSGLIIKGALTADLSQSCVVTLEPVPAHLEEPVEGRYLPGAEAALLRQDETLADPDEPDPPEPLPQSGAIDLGELVVQHLAVALDPYPKTPGVAFEPPDQNPQAASPFARLAALKPPPKT
jgi:hypothetical protein